MGSRGGWARPGLRWFPSAAGLFLPALLGGAAAAPELSAQIRLESPEGRLAIEIGVWIQPRYELYAEFGQEELSSFYLRRTRLDLSGYLFSERLTFRLQPELANQPNLRDAYFDYVFTRGVALRVGQHPVPFQWRVSPRRWQFAEAGVASAAFAFPKVRDVGVLLHGESQAGTVSYGLGIYDGAGANVRRSNSAGNMVSGRVHVALRGRLPADESDYRRVNRIVGVGAGVLAASRNEIRDWSLGRSAAANGRGDWVAGVLDVQVQERGFTLSAYGFRRAVSPADGAVGSYEGAGGEVSAGYAVVAGRVELVGRYGALRWSLDDARTRETGWDLVLTIYHRGHDWRTRVQYSAERRFRLTGFEWDRLFLAEAQVLF